MSEPADLDAAPAAGPPPRRRAQDPRRWWRRPRAVVLAAAAAVVAATGLVAHRAGDPDPAATTAAATTTAATGAPAPDAPTAGSTTTTAPAPTGSDADPRLLAARAAQDACLRAARSLGPAATQAGLECAAKYDLVERAVLSERATTSAPLRSASHTPAPALSRSAGGAVWDSGAPPAV